MGVPLDVLTVCDGDQPMMKLELLLNPIYTIQPVVQPAVSCKQAFNRLSNRVVHPVWQTRIDNRLNVCIHDTASCQTGCQTGLTTVLNKQLFVQRVVKPVWQPVWQQVVSCKRGFTVTHYVCLFVRWYQGIWCQTTLLFSETEYVCVWRKQIHLVPQSDWREQSLEGHIMFQFPIHYGT